MGELRLSTNLQKYFTTYNIVMPRTLQLIDFWGLRADSVKINFIVN